MIRCLIVDDEPLAIRALEHLLADVPDVEVVATCTRPLQAAALVRERAVDLILLDIEMPGLSGLDFVRSLTDPPRVVFTTAHREHAVEGFDLDAVDYLLKPVSLPRLLRALDKARMRSAPHPGERPSAELRLKADRKLVTLPVREIALVSSLGDYVVLHGGRRPVTVRMTLGEMASRLEPHGFVRIHRSTVVNPAHVTEWSGGEVVVAGKRLPVGRSYRRAVLDVMAGLAR